MAYTKADLRNQVLEKLGILEAGETASAEDTVLVETRYDQVYDLLFNAEVASWTDHTDIPEHAMLPMTYLVAAECIDEYDIQEPRLSRILAIASRAENALIRQEAPRYRSEPTKADYY